MRAALLAGFTGFFAVIGEAARTAARSAAFVLRPTALRPTLLRAALVRPAVLAAALVRSALLRATMRM